MKDHARILLAGLAVVLAALLVAGACGGSDPSPGGPAVDATGPPQAARDADPCTVAPKPGSRDIEFLSSGRPRQAWLHLPRAAKGKHLPLVVAFHFAGGTGPEMEKSVRLSQLGDREGFAVLYPSAAKKHFWALRTNDEPDDVEILNNLLDHVEATVCIDTDRIYGTGVSNGGGMAARVGCELSDRFAAVAPVAGGYRALDPCKPDRPVSVLEIHSTSDTVVPYRGRGPSHAGSVPAYLSGWVGRDECSSGASSRSRGHGVVEQDWTGCLQGTAVRHLRLTGTTHGWPGSPGPFPRRDPSGISADREVWRFFKDKTLTRQTSG